MEGGVFRNVRVDLEFIFTFESRSNIWEKVILQGVIRERKCIGNGKWRNMEALKVDINVYSVYLVHEHQAPFLFKEI
jgi:hypothetical protein